MNITQSKSLCHQIAVTSFAISACLLVNLLVNTAQAATRLPKSPWQSHASLKSSQVSPIYQQQWRQSDYKYCPILAIANHSSVNVKTAQSRAANFSGGFAVAYDLKNYKGKPLRSAYGVANTGTTSKRDLYEGWAYRKNYADGSYVTLGREGNNPQGKMLAYLVLNNGCFYNIWSQLSSDHLQKMIAQLRYVN